MIISHIFLHSLVRWMDLIGMILLMGGLVFRTLVVSPSPSQASSLERLLPLLLLLIGLSDLVLRSQMISGQPLGQVWPFLPAVLFKSHFGKVWMVRMFFLCFLSVTSIIKAQGRLKEGLATTAGAFLLLTASLSGHAADSGDFSLAVLVDWLHVLAVSAWIGSLLFLALYLRKWVISPRMEPTSPALIASVKRFSTLAGVCVALILVTGSYQIWLQVRSLAALLQTPYGQTLMGKLFLVFLILGLGAVNRYRILPKLSQQAVAESLALVGDYLKRFLKIVRLEVGLGLGIIACVALLIQLPPARSQLGSAYQFSNHPMAHLHQGETSSSRLQPAEGASVKILSPKEGEVTEGDQVPIHFKLVGGKRGHHVHAYVDGELMGMFETEKGTLTGIKPGKHTLEARVVAEDHQTELDATDRVQFMVK